MNYQNFTMLGRMTRDPELKFLPSNVPVVSFGMACSRKYRTGAGEDREETLFIDCQAFGKPAEILSQYGNKGKPLLITGRLRLETWEDRNGGGKLRQKLSDGSGEEHGRRRGLGFRFHVIRRRGAIVFGIYSESGFSTVAVGCAKKRI